MKEILSEMRHDSSTFYHKKSFRESVTLGRKERFDVEVLDFSEMLRRTQLSSEDNLQKILKTKSSYAEIMSNYDFLKKLKQVAPIDYQGVSWNVFLSEFLGRFKDEFKPNFLLGTLRVEMNGKLYAMSRYLSTFNLDSKNDPIEELVRNSKVLIAHQDTFLIEDTLKEISKIFADAVNWSPTKILRELKDNVALFRFMYTHCSPCIRGSGAIGDWFELALYRYHGFRAHFN